MHHQQLDEAVAEKLARDNVAAHVAVHPRDSASPLRESGSNQTAARGTLEDDFVQLANMLKIGAGSAVDNSHRNSIQWVRIK